MITIFLEDNRLAADVYAKYLERGGYTDFIITLTRDEFFKRFDESTEIIVLDYRIPEPHGVEVLIEAKKINPLCFAVMCSDQTDLNVAVDALMKHGLNAYVNKRNYDHHAELLTIIQKAKKEMAIIRSKAKAEQNLIKYLEQMSSKYASN